MIIVVGIAWDTKVRSRSNVGRQCFIPEHGPGGLQDN